MAPSITLASAFWLRNTSNSLSSSMDGAFLSAHSMDDQRNQTTVIFACPKCGLVHEVTQEHVPAKMSGGFDCADCGTAVHSWYGFFDYSNWKAIKLSR